MSRSIFVCLFLALAGCTPGSRAVVGTGMVGVGVLGVIASPHICEHSCDSTAAGALLGTLVGSAALAGTGVSLLAVHDSDPPPPPPVTPKELDPPFSPPPP